MSTDEIDQTPISTERDGIKVTKTFDADTYDGQLAIRLTIESVHNKPLDIRVLDEFPETIPTSEIAFSPEYSRDKWERHEDKYVVFTTPIGPDETIDTLYFTTGHTDVAFEEFRSKPQVVESTVVSEEPDTEDVETESETPNQGSIDSEPDTSTDGSLTDFTNDTETQTEGDTEADNNTDVIQGTSPLSASDTEADSESDTDSNQNTDTTATPDDDGTTPSDVAPDTESTSDSASVVDAFCAELEADAVDDESLTTIADALGKHIQTDGAPEARLQHLESQVTELEAYSTALEGFLNDSGTAQTLVEDVESLKDSVDSLDDRLDDLATTDSDDQESLTGVEGELEDLHDDVETLLSWRDAMTTALGQDSENS